MRIKKIFATTLAAAMLISGTISSVGAAGNYTDTSFSFTITSTKKSTIPRPKMDDTSSSIKITSGTGNARVKVQGLLTNTTSTMVDCTAGTAKVVSQSSVYTYLPNYVYEWGYSYCNLGLTSTGSSFAAEGKWSPDSI